MAPTYDVTGNLDPCSTAVHDGADAPTCMHAPPICFPACRCICDCASSHDLCVCRETQMHASIPTLIKLKPIRSWEQTALSVSSTISAALGEGNLRVLHGRAWVAMERVGVAW